MKTKHAEKTGARKDPLQIASYISSSCLSSPRVSSGKKNVDGLMRLVITQDAAALVGQLQNPSLGHFSSIYIYIYAQVVVVPRATLLSSFGWIAVVGLFCGVSGHPLQGLHEIR